MATRPIPPSDTNTNEGVANNVAATTTPLSFDGLNTKQNRDFNRFIDALPDDAKQAVIENTEVPANLTSYNNEASTTAYNTLISNTTRALESFDKKLAEDNGITGQAPTPNVDAFNRAMHDQVKVDINIHLTDALANDVFANEIGFAEPDEISERLDSYHKRIDDSLINASNASIAPRRRLSLVNRMLADDFDTAVGEYAQALDNPTEETLAQLSKDKNLMLQAVSRSSYDNLAAANTNASANPTGFIDFLSETDHPFHPSITDDQKNLLLRSMLDFDQGMRQDVGLALQNKKDNPTFNYDKTVDQIAAVAMLNDRRAEYHPALDSKTGIRFAESFPKNLEQVAAQLQERAAAPSNEETPQPSTDINNIDINDLLSAASQEDSDRYELSQDPRDSIVFNNLPPDDPSLQFNESGIVPPTNALSNATAVADEPDALNGPDDNVPATKAKPKTPKADDDKKDLPAGIVRAIPIKITPSASENLMKAVEDNEYLAGKFDLGELDDFLHSIDDKLLNSDKPPSATIHSAILNDEMSVFLKGLTDDLVKEPNADGTKKNYIEGRQVGVDIEKAITDITSQYYKDSPELMDFPNTAETQYPSPLSEEQVDAVRHAVADLPNGAKHHALYELKTNLKDNPDYKFDDVVKSLQTSLHEYDATYKTIRPDAEPKLSAFTDVLTSKIEESNKTADVKTTVKPFEAPAPTPSNSNTNANTGGDGNSSSEDNEIEDTELTDEEKAERERARQNGGGKALTAAGPAGGGTRFSLFPPTLYEDMKTGVKTIFKYAGKGIVGGIDMMRDKDSLPTATNATQNNNENSDTQNLNAQPNEANNALTGKEHEAQVDALINDLATGPNPPDDKVERKSRLNEDGTVTSEHEAQVDSLVDTLATTPDPLDSPSASVGMDNDNQNQPLPFGPPPSVPDNFTALQTDDFNAVTTGMKNLVSDFKKTPSLSNEQLIEKTTDLLNSIQISASDVAISAYDSARDTNNNDKSESESSFDNMTKYLEDIRQEAKDMSEKRGLLEENTVGTDQANTNQQGSAKEGTPDALKKAFDETEDTLKNVKASTARVFAGLKLGNIGASIGRMFGKGK